MTLMLNGKNKACSYANAMESWLFFSNRSRIFKQSIDLEVKI